MKPAIHLKEGEIFRPVAENGITGGTKVWSRAQKIQFLPDDLRNIIVHTYEHGSVGLPRYHRVEVQ